MSLSISITVKFQLPENIQFQLYDYS